VSRSDSVDVEMRTIVEHHATNPFPPKRKRRTKKKKTVEVIGQNDYVEYETVDQELQGYMFSLFLWPSVQPNDVIEIKDYEPLQDVKHVVKVVRHYGSVNQSGDYCTELETDDYADEDF